MTFLFIAIAGCLLVMGIWSIPITREYILALGPGIWDEWLEQWFALVLTLVLASLFFFVVRHDGSKSGGPAEAPIANSAPDTIISPAPEPSSNIPNLPGQVIARDEYGQVVPLPGVTLKLGQNQTLSDGRGQFQLPLYPIPKSDSLLQVLHDAYVTRFMRYDDPLISAHKPIELTPKMRIIVVEAAVNAVLQTGDSRLNVIRSNLESQLRCNEIEMLADDALREDVIGRLYKNQEGRALYDSRTLQKVGDFHGATHGVFWSVERQTGGLRLECKLVSFKTTQIVQSVSVRLENESLLTDASLYLADLLLAQLAEIKILSPKTGTICTRILPVEGYALYQPKTWTLWLTLLPEGNHRHYPQLKITVQNDGSWFASAVYVGADEPITRTMPFRIYAVLTDPDYTRRITDYLAHNKDEGIEFSPNDAQHYRILDNLRVMRRDTEEHRSAHVLPASLMHGG